MTVDAAGRPLGRSLPESLSRSVEMEVETGTDRSEVDAAPVAGKKWAEIVRLPRCPY